MPAGHYIMLHNKVDTVLESPALGTYNAKKIRLNHVLFLELLLTLILAFLGSPKLDPVNVQTQQVERAVVSQTWCMDAECQADASDMCSCFAGSSYLEV